MFLLLPGSTFLSPMVWPFTAVPWRKCQTLENSPKRPIFWPNESLLTCQRIPDQVEDGTWFVVDVEAQCIVFIRQLDDEMWISINCQQNASVTTRLAVYFLCKSFIKCIYPSLQVMQCKMEENKIQLHLETRDYFKTQNTFSIQNLSVGLQWGEVLPRYGGAVRWSVNICQIVRDKK